MPIDYTKSLEESIPEYKSRIAQERSELPQQVPEPSEIDVETMQAPSEQVLDIPETQFETPDYQKQIEQKDAQIKTLRSETEEEKEIETSQDEMFQKMLETISTPQEREEREAELREEKELPEQEAQLRDLSSQLEALNTQAQLIPSIVEESFEGRGATSAGVQPFKAGKLRQNAIKAAQVAAQANFLNNRVITAQESIRNALDLEFGDEEIRLETINLLYQRNQEQLAEIDEERTRNLALYLDERDRLINEQKEQKEQIYNIGLTAMQNGASIQESQRIMGAETREQAAMLASPYLQQKQITELDTQETVLNGRRVIIDMQTGNVIRDLGVADDDPDDPDITVDLTPEDERTLMGAGFNTEEISDVIRSVNDFGVSAVIEALDDPQKIQAVKDIYNIEPDFDVQSAADRFIASQIETKYFSFRHTELEDAIDKSLQLIEDFGIEGISEEQQEDIRRAIQEKEVSRDEAKRIVKLQELLK